MNVAILVAAFLISFIFISIHSYKLGKSKVENEIFGSSKDVIYETFESKEDISFMAVVYDLNSPIYKHIKNVPNPHNINLEQLVKLKDILLDRLMTQELDESETIFISGQLDILNRLLKTHVRLDRKENA